MISSNDKIREAFFKLPYAVRGFILSPDFGIFLKGIGTQYGFVNEKQTAFSDLVGEMAIGLVPPAELPARLTALGLDEQRSKTMLAEIEKQVMRPLGLKFKQSDEEARKEQERAEDVEFGAEPDEPKTSAIPTNQTLSAKTPEATISKIAPTVTVAPAPVQSTATYTPPAPVMPKMRTMEMDVEKTEEPKKPAPPVSKPVSAPVAAPKPAPIATPAKPVPQAPAAPVRSMPTPAAIMPAPTAPKAASVKDDLKDFGIDPYREPVE